MNLISATPSLCDLGHVLYYSDLVSLSEKYNTIASVLKGSKNQMMGFKYNS